MIYQIVSPIVTPIYGDSFKEAIKNYVKFNHNLNINNLIIKDQSQHWEARLRYYKENQKNKVGIDVYPYTNITYPMLAPGIAARGIGPIVSPGIGPVVSPGIAPGIAARGIVSPGIVSPGIAPGIVSSGIVAPGIVSPFAGTSIVSTPMIGVNVPPIVTSKNSPFVATNNGIFMKARWN
jgi:hypothetical protein